MYIYKKLFMDHIKKHQEEIKGRIYGSYNIEKSNEDELEKGGEGSRGGKVIGHTQSGKAIYEAHKPKQYKDFSQKDHYDAAIIHSHLAKENKTSVNQHLEVRGGGYYHHKEKAEEHIKAMKHEGYYSTGQLKHEFFKKDKKTGLYVPQKEVIKNSSIQAKKNKWDDWSNL